MKINVSTQWFESIENQSYNISFYKFTKRNTLNSETKPVGFCKKGFYCANVNRVTSKCRKSCQPFGGGDVLPNDFLNIGDKVLEKYRYFAFFMKQPFPFSLAM